MIGNILGIDTTTGFLGIIARRGEECVSVTANTGFRHGEQVLPWIETTLAKLDLTPRKIELVVTALGPGSFTGLRIGLAAAKGLAAGTGAALVGVPTPDTFGHRYGFFEGTVYPVIDARKKRFYSAAYENGQRVTDFLDCTPEELIAAATDRPRSLFTGPDAALLATLFPGGTPPETIRIAPSPVELTALLELGLREFEQNGPLPENSGPIYLRKSEAEIVRDAHSPDPGNV